MANADVLRTSVGMIDKGSVIARPTRVKRLLLGAKRSAHAVHVLMLEIEKREIWRMQRLNHVEREFLS
jgi:hypothetical protein